MKVKDMQPGVAYATCDGVYVELRDPIRRGWFESTYKGNKVTHTFHDADDLDPWGPCVDARRPPTIGVLCDQYEVDRDGVKRDDTKTETIVNPRDVKGTWIDYLVLHGQTVRERGIERERRETIRRVEQLLHDVEQPKGVGLENSWYDLKWHYGSLEPSGQGYDELIDHVEVRFSLTAAGFIEFMTRLGVTVPEGTAATLLERYRTERQWKALQARRNEQRTQRKAKAKR